jgi:D-alanyl-lipoteichoic acid acyltransferase DltB (MBOAT superfamily)
MNRPPRFKPLGFGFVFLLISLVLALVLPHASGQENTVFLGWLENAAFWLGIICIAAQLFILLLGYRDEDRAAGR